MKTSPRYPSVAVAKCRSLLGYLLLLCSTFAPQLSAAPGDLLPFEPNLSDRVLAAAIQPDGNIVISGPFYHLQYGTPEQITRIGLARLHADGSPDASYYPYPDNRVYAVAALENGQILVGGDFTSFQEGGPASGNPTVLRNKLARLNANGSVDGTFNPNISGGGIVLGILPLTNGQIYICGSFTTVGGEAHARVARLNEDGSPDSAFSFQATAEVTNMALDQQGRLLLGSHSVIASGRVARVATTGILDASFDPNPDFAVYGLQAQANDQVLICGYYDNIGGQPIRNLARVEDNGTVDGSFLPGPGSAVQSLTVLTDGKVLATGYFTQFQPSGDPSPSPRAGLALLQPSGALVSSFNPLSSGAIDLCLVENDGSLLLLHPGSITTVQGQHSAMTRLEGEPVSSELSASSSSRVQWLRSGGLAEPAYVVFDLSIDSGSTWTRLGTGTRISGGWELNGLALPSNGKLRACARVNSSTAYYCCSSVLETVENFVVPLTVPGSANVWLAGAAPTATARNTDDLTTAAPTLAPITVTPGQDVTFDVIGGTHNGPIGPGTTDPDGGTDAEHETENSIAELKAPLNSLVGVFLNANQPSGSPSPYRDFTNAENRNDDMQMPGLQQPFFIGNGRTITDTLQRVRIPDGATRLYLGSFDQFDNAGNFGAFDVVANVIAPLPDLATEFSQFQILNGELGEDWNFSIKQNPESAGRTLRVQSRIGNGLWSDLPVGGEMTLGAGGVWSLTTTAIPLGSQRQFRVLAEASGFQGTGFEYDTPFDVLHPAGRILYSRGSFGSTEMVLMEVDGSGKTVLTDATASPLRCLLSPDGTMAAFTTFAGELFVMKAELMNATTNVPVNVLDGSGSSVLFNAIPTWAPDGQHIAFADPTSHIQVIEAVDLNGEPQPFESVTNPLVDVYTSLSGEPNVVWSPDGKYLALTEGSVIVAFEVTDAGGAITPAIPGSAVSLTDGAEFATQKTAVSWSADGRQIAFVQKIPLSGDTELALLNVRNAGGTLTPETGSNPRSFIGIGRTQTVSWSPDASLLVVEVNTGGASHVEVLKPEAYDAMTNPGEVLTLADTEGDAFQPSFQLPSRALVAGSLVAFEATSYAGNEDDEDPISVRVVRTGPTSGPLTVEFAVTSGTAVEDSDYTLSASPLVFAAGETEKTIIVTPLIDAAEFEGDETVLLELQSPIGGEIGGIPQTTVVISDSDSNLQPFTPSANSLTVAVNGRTLRSGKGKSGDELKFTARQEQGWNIGGLEVKMQYTTTPKDAGSWVNLPEPSMSRSTLTSLTWVATTRKFPTGKLYFRTRSYSIGHRSNGGPVVGPFTIVAAPVIELTMDVVSDSDATGLTVKPGEFITYNLKCKNVGSAKASKITLNSRLPQSTRFDSASHNNGTFPGYFSQVAGAHGVITDVRWKVGDIQPGAEVDEFLTVQVDQTADFNRLIQNDRLTYRISTGKEIFMPIFRTTVSSPIKISIAKDKNIVVAGDLITYTLTIHNEASFTVTGGQVTDETPLGTRLISSAHGDGAGNYLGSEVGADTLTESPNGLLDPGFTAYNGMLTWNVGDVEPGGSRQLRFTVRVAYDLFEKLQRNGESFQVQIQNLNFDYTGTPPSGGVISAWAGVIRGSDIARTFVSEEAPTYRPEMGLQKTAISDTWAKLASADIAAVFADGNRVIAYELAVWNYGNVAAVATELFDGVPYETELNADNYLVGNAATDVLTTELPHQLSTGQRVLLPYLTGGSGLGMTTIYFVQSTPSPTQFTVAKTATGAAVNFTTDVTAGALRRIVYDSDAFMRKFSLDGVPVTSSAGFHFFDANGSHIDPGGEPFIDHNGDGKIGTSGHKTAAELFSGASEFYDQNGNNRYDGPGAIRSFSYALGNLASMTSPATRQLTYHVQLTSKVRAHEYITALSSAMHKKGEGLELTCPDFYYPVIGTPPIEFTKVVNRMVLAMDRPVPHDTAFIDGTAGNSQVVYDLTFTNKGSFYATDAKIRVPIPAGFTTPSAPLLPRNATYDVALPGSPGTAVFDIGEVEPEQTVTRQLVLNMTTPIPANLFTKGVLKNFAAPVFPRVYTTKASASAQSTSPSGQAMTAASSDERLVFAMKADGSGAVTTPVKSSSTEPGLFIGRICDRSVLEGGPDFEIFIFFGNVGGKNSGPGEMAMQVPYGTRLISADPLSYNPLEGTTSTTAFFPPNYFTIQQIKGKRRAEDGPIEVVRWKFPNIAPSNVYCVKMKVQVTKPFPGTSIVDKSAYVTSTYSAAKVSTPLIIKVRKDANGATDWWQAVGDLLQSFGFGVDDSVRNLLGEDTKSITLGSTTASIGGVDAVQLVGGQLILPLGQGRSLIIGPGSQLFSGQVPNESMISASEGDGLAMAAGATSSQQVYVGGTINDYRNVHTLLDQLASSTNSIVAAGGGNIVAAGGGNIVAAGGGNIVAGGGGNVVSNDGAGFVGHVNFSNIPSIVAAGGGNIVAAGGGNIVAGGGGNIVAAGGGNIVAAGGGNIVAAGGGNLVEIGSRQIQPKDMTGLINSLIGQEGANLTDVVLLKQIGANVLSNDGAGVVVLDPNSLIGQDAASLIGQDGAGIVAGGGLNNQ